MTGCSGFSVIFECEFITEFERVKNGKAETGVIEICEAIPTHNANDVFEIPV
jgi:hypothetical protein